MTAPTPFANAHNPDVERAVLAVLLDGRHAHLQAVLCELCPTADYFWTTKHMWVARVIHLMIQRGERVDAQRVALAMQRIRYQDFHEKGKPISLEDGLTLSDSLAAGMPANEVMDLLGGFGAPSGFQANCETLAEFHAQRQAIALLSESLEAIGAPSGSAKLPAIADQLINRMARIVTAQEGAGTLAEAMERAIQRHDAMRLKGDAKTATWGLPGLDRALPLASCRFMVLAAQPGHGKTSLGLQAAMATAEALGPGSVGFVSLEMNAEQLGTILLARQIRVMTRTIENGKLSAEQSQQASEAIAQWGKTDIYLRSTHGKCRIDDLCGWIRTRHSRSGGRLALVVFDYLQLVDPKDHRQTTYEAISEATRELKRIALEKRICLLALAQLNREGTKADRDASGRAKGNPEPRPQDLRGSGTIEQDADGIVFIWPPYNLDGQTNPDLPCFLKVAKNRSGGTRTLDAVFRRGQGQVFEEMVSTRAHHNHPPRPDEDKYAQMAAEQAKEGSQE